MAKKSKFARGIRNKQRKQQEEATGNGGIFKSDVDFQKWKPGKGAHLIDVIPYFAGKNDYPEAREEGTFMFSFGVHYNVGIDKKAFVCPKTIPGAKDKRCPICEHAAKLKNEGENFDVYKRYFPKKREMYNVVVQDSQKEQDKGAQVFEVSYYFMGKLLEPIVKKPVRPGEDITDAYIDFAIETEDGKTISFEVGEKKVNTVYFDAGEKKVKEDTFPTFTGHRFVSRDYNLDEYLDEAKQLDELLYIPSYKEIKEAFWDTPSEETEEEEVGGDTFKERMNKKNQKNQKKQEDKEEGSEDSEDKEEDSEDAKEKEISNNFSDINTDDMDRKQLKIFIKKNNVPLDHDLGDDLKDYDDEDLRFVIEDFIENN